MRLTSITALALSLLCLGCPADFTAKNPPCATNDDCSVEKLGNDFPDHVCRNDQCFARQGAPSPSDGGVADTGPAPLYDAGPAVDTGRVRDCSRDDECPEGHICSGGYCVEGASGCTTNAECPGENDVCLEGACLVGCPTGHQDCLPTDVCLDAICVDRPVCGAARVPAPPADAGAGASEDAGPRPDAGGGSCPADLRCLDGRCSRPECYDGQACPEDQQCQAGRCVPV
jgi:hypothetical protein